MGLNEETARTIGILHDYGRKFGHNFMHTIKGFEGLVDLGLFNESIAALTHSFVNGGRCSYNDKAKGDFM